MDAGFGAPPVVIGPRFANGMVNQAATFAANRL
jgi:hypothetical protein